MSFLFKWLKPQTSARVGLRPHRDVRLPLDYDAAYARVIQAIEVTLGASVSIDDRQGRLVEGAFGLINNERIRVSFEIVAQNETHLRIEAYYPAGFNIPEKSTAVTVLADALEAGITP
jgi:hypothetical protein